MLHKSGTDVHQALLNTSNRHDSTSVPHKNGVILEVGVGWGGVGLAG